MLRTLLIENGFLAVLLVIAAGTAIAQEFKARLSGFFEIGASTTIPAQSFPQTQAS